MSFTPRPGAQDKNLTAPTPETSPIPATLEHADRTPVRTWRKQRKRSRASWKTSELPISSNAFRLFSTHLREFEEDKAGGREGAGTGRPNRSSGQGSNQTGRRELVRKIH